GLGKVEDFESIDAAPIFPIEAVGTAVCGSDEVAPGLSGIGFGLAHGFDARAVSGKKKRAGRIGTVLGRGGSDGEILNAAVDAAAKGLLVMLVWIADAQSEGAVVKRS